MSALEDVIESINKMGKPLFELVFQYWKYILLALLLLILYMLMGGRLW